MMVTEEEASKLICCGPPCLQVMAQVMVSIQMGNAKHHGVQWDIGCRGSKCMAWRWVKDRNVSGYGYCGLVENDG